MLPTRRDSGQPHHFSPEDAPAQAFTLRHWASLWQPKHRGCILTNPSIPALGYAVDRGHTFLLAPIKGFSSTIMREMLGSHTYCRGNGTTPTAAVVRYMSSMARTPGSPQWQPLGAIRAGCSLCHRQGQPVAPLTGSPPGPHCTCPFCGLAALGISQGEQHHSCRGSLGHDQCGQVTPGSPWQWPPGLCGQVTPSATGGGQPAAPLTGSPQGLITPAHSPAALSTSLGKWHHPCGSSLGHAQHGQVTPWGHQGRSLLLPQVGPPSGTTRWQPPRASSHLPSPLPKGHVPPLPSDGP